MNEVLISIWGGLQVFFACSAFGSGGAFFFYWWIIAIRKAKTEHDVMVKRPIVFQFMVAYGLAMVVLSILSCFCYWMELKHISQL